jgi:hypothetical protein
VFAPSQLNIRTTLLSSYSLIVQFHNFPRIIAKIKVLKR